MMVLMNNLGNVNNVEFFREFVNETVDMLKKFEGIDLGEKVDILILGGRSEHKDMLDRSCIDLSILLMLLNNKMLTLFWVAGMRKETKREGEKRKGRRAGTLEESAKFGGSFWSWPCECSAASFCPRERRKKESIRYVKIR